MYDLSETDVARLNLVLEKVTWDYPWLWDNVREEMSEKEWLIQKWWADKVDLIDKAVNIMCGGVHFYSVPFAHQKGAQYIHCYDLDPTAISIGWSVNKFYKPELQDMKALNVVFDYEEMNQYADVWINTSCEHSYNFKKVIPSGKMCVLSGNNLSKRGHINRINSCEELAEQNGIVEILNSEVMQFNFEDDRGKQEYEQFMIIGIKE